LLVRFGLGPLTCSKDWGARFLNHRSIRSASRQSMPLSGCALAEAKQPSLIHRLVPLFRAKPTDRKLIPNPGDRSASVCQLASTTRGNPRTLSRTLGSNRLSDPESWLRPLRADRTSALPVGATPTHRSSTLIPLSGLSPKRSSALEQKATGCPADFPVPSL
jgi:hypothetical protein